MPRSHADARHALRQSRTVLLATDSRNSVIAEFAGDKPGAIAYTAYGQQSAQQQVATGLGFNGELCEARLGWYLLGNGYRAYNPTLMRFHSPDSWSPFGKGGLNAYMYCGGEPVMGSDSSGHFNPSKWWGNIRSFVAGTRNRLALTPKKLSGYTALPVKESQSSETPRASISVLVPTVTPEPAKRILLDLVPPPRRYLKPTASKTSKVPSHHQDLVNTSSDLGLRLRPPLPDIENAISARPDGMELVNLQLASEILRGSS